MGEVLYLEKSNHILKLWVDIFQLFHTYLRQWKSCIVSVADVKHSVDCVRRGLFSINI